MLTSSSSSRWTAARPGSARRGSTTTRRLLPRTEIAAAAASPPARAGVNTGNDQWWPWIDVNEQGHLNIVFKDRRLDTGLDRRASGRRAARARATTSSGPGADSARPSMGTADECVSADADGDPAARRAGQPVGAIPGCRPESSLGDWDNFGISDVPSNWDYYVPRRHLLAATTRRCRPKAATAYAFFTDARNGRSSGGPAGGATAPSQPGRNPACEQSDVFVDHYGSDLGLERSEAARSRPMRSSS